MRRRPKAAGFTLIELLVVITIIGVLVGLLLPAVNAAREAARRSQCCNNLVQIGVALHTYESTHEVFPPGVVDSSDPVVTATAGYHMSWIVQILPFLEEGNAYRKVNFRASVYDVRNATVRGHGVRSLLCPDESIPGKLAGLGLLGTDIALTSYAGCHHDVEAPIARSNRGVFYLNSAIRRDQISDGSSQTFFVGEKRLDTADMGWMSGTRATLRNTGSPLNRVLVGPGAPGFSGEDDDADAAAAAGAATPGLSVGGFSSFHPGGANFLMGDGSVRFVSTGIAPQVYRRLGNRADGELLETDDY